MQVSYSLISLFHLFLRQRCHPLFEFWNFLEKVNDLLLVVNTAPVAGTHKFISFFEESIAPILFVLELCYNIVLILSFIEHCVELVYMIHHSCHHLFGTIISSLVIFLIFLSCFFFIFRGGENISVRCHV